MECLETRVNQELKNVHDCLCANKLSLNIDETNFVVFHPFQEKLTKTIFTGVNLKFIKQKDHIKYLGVVIDSHVSLKEHIYQLSKKISRGIGILAKLHHYVSVTILTQLYSSLTYPFLMYGATIWGNTYETTLHPLIILQKKAV